VNESEAQIVKNESLAIFKLWCAKECLFKEKQGKLEDLKNAASLVRLNPDNLVLENLGTEFTYEFKVINDYILVYSF
jgi:hypothetical protein